MQVKVNSNTADGTQSAEIVIGNKTFHFTEQLTDTEGESLLKVVKVAESAKQDTIAIVPAGGTNSIFLS